jgi:two-component system sensor histidine kinase UhpB
MTIADNGVGFEPASSTSGLGLRNMRERIEKLHGAIQVLPNGARGSKIVAEIPLSKGA